MADQIRVPAHKSWVQSGEISMADSDRRLFVVEPTDQRWLALTAADSRTSIFHCPAWMSLLEECYGYQPFVLVMCNAQGESLAGLPVMELRSPLRGRRWVSLPFSDYCMPLYRSPESLVALTEALVQLWREGRAPAIELRWEFPANTAITPYSQYVLHTLKLELDASLVSKGFARMHRQNIGTAEKRGIRLERAARPRDMDQFYRLQLNARHRQGVPVQPRGFFDRLWRVVIAQGLGFVLLAYKDSECIAGAVFLHWGHTLTCKYAASLAETRNLRPNNLIFWDGIRWGCENGYAWFDMGRTDPDNSGLREFKARWGASETPLTYSSIGSRPPSHRAVSLTRLSGAVIRNAPDWVCKAAGELLYKHVG